MKKIILCSVALFISGSVVAANSAFSNAPAPTQAYHSASYDQSAQTATTTTTVAQSATPAPATAPDTTSPAATINAGGIDTSAQGQAAQAEAQGQLVFQQEADQHFQSLDASDQAMGSAIQTIDQNITQLQHEVGQLQSGHAESAPVKMNFLNLLNRDDLNVFIVFGGAAAFLLLFGVLMGRLMRRSPKVVAVNNMSSHKVGDLLSDDTKSEYDFMGTKAAIPAKLDLARSYMAMSDHDQARAVLKTVLEKGDEEQRMVAEALLTKINKMA